MKIDGKDWNYEETIILDNHQFNWAIYALGVAGMIQVLLAIHPKFYMLLKNIFCCFSRRGNNEISTVSILTILLDID